MSNRLHSGSHHERRAHIPPLDHEAAVKRWPIRHTAEQTFDWSLRASFGVALDDLLPAVAPPQRDFQSLGSNVVDLAPRLSQQGETAPEADAVEQFASAEGAPVYDFEALKRAAETPGDGDSLATKGLSGDASASEGLDIEAIRRVVEEQAA